MGSDEWSRQRKDNHKEVDRRRRENINEGINELGRMTAHPAQRLRREGEGRYEIPEAILRSVDLAQSIKCSNDKFLRVLSGEIIVFNMNFAVVADVAAAGWTAMHKYAALVGGLRFNQEARAVARLPTVTCAGAVVPEGNSLQNSLLRIVALKRRLKLLIRSGIENGANGPVC
ncbi:hypothetical protein BJ912DRAFT_1062220 [Pholiota molesta]|nr:hypothetical protein BJ912DRAFT_1062220 [Pholiota molesta]